MDLQNKLLAKKRCYELVWQSALSTWQRDLVEFKCPACGSNKIGAHPRMHGKNPCWCPICNHCFDQPREFICDCPEPGSQSKCHDCPNFHKLLAIVKAKAEALQSHSFDPDLPSLDS